MKFLKITLCTLVMLGASFAQAQTEIVCIADQSSFSITIYSEKTVPNKLLFQDELYEIELTLADYRLYQTSKEVAVVSGINTRLDVGVNYFIDLGYSEFTKKSSSINFQEIYWHPTDKTHFDGQYKIGEKSVKLSCERILQ